MREFPEPRSLPLITPPSATGAEIERGGQPTSTAFALASDESCIDAGDAAIVLAVVACFALTLPAYWSYVNDDSFISFRYAANLLAGGDRMPGWRFWVPALPVLFLMLAAPVDRLLKLLWSRSRAAALAALLPCLLIGWALAGLRQELAEQCRERGEAQREAHLYIGALACGQRKP